jgi:hypothetical protein
MFTAQLAEDRSGWRSGCRLRMYFLRKETKMLTPHELRNRAEKYLTEYALAEPTYTLKGQAKEGFIYGYTLGYYDAYAELTSPRRVAFQSPSEESGRPSIP